MKEKIVRCKNIYIILACLLLSVAFVTLFSVSTSPLYPIQSHICDSYIFQVVGKGWGKGILPYVGLWDSKGPLVYVIDALGYLMTDNRFGVWIIQLLFMFVTILMFFKWMYSVYSLKTSIIYTMAGLFFLTLIYANGNMTEEYLLPALTLSFFLMHRWAIKVDNGYTNHNVWYSFIYGVTIGLSILSRVTNAVGICAGIAVISIYTIREGMIKSLFSNLIFVFAGVLISILPFMVYLYCNGH